MAGDRAPLRGATPGGGQQQTGAGRSNGSAEAGCFLAEIDQRQRAAERVLLRAVSVGDVDLVVAAGVAARLLGRCQVFMRGIER